MRAMLKVTRQQVLGYRVATQGLHRDAETVTQLAVLDIGIQDSGADGARLAIDARLASPAVEGGIGPAEALALVWSLRGAPHVHRRVDLDDLASALWPLSESDAAGRLNQTRAHLADAGLSAVDGLRASAAAVRSVVHAPITKGALSTAVTPIVPDALTGYCRGCKATHIGDLVLRVAALPAGAELEPGTAPPVLVARVGAQWPVESDVAAVQRLIIAYLHLLGPATPAEVAGYLDSRRADVTAVWPDGLSEVAVDGVSAWLPAQRADALAAAKPAELVRLLGPFDPWVQARDRDLIVPDRAAQKALWPVLGRPGVLLVDGEVLGAWRSRSSGRKLTLAIEAFAPLSTSTWDLIDGEAGRIAAVRGASDVQVNRVA